VLWATWVAPSTVDYLRPHVDGALSQAADLLRGHGSRASAARHMPFTASAAPAYERICAFAAQLIVAAVTLVALLQTWRDRKSVGRAFLFVPCLLLVLVYFGSLPLTLVSAGGEPAHRLWSFTYLGVALVAVWGFPQWERAARRLGKRAVVAVGGVAVMVVAIGNVAAGENVYYRFPGPYAFGTDTRAQTPELTQLSSWANAHLPGGSKVVTDRFTSEVLTAQTRLVTQSPEESYATTLYREGDAASQNLRSYLATHEFRYWIVDMRILTMQPAQRFFQGYTEPDSVSPVAIATAGSSSFLRLVRSTDHYRIYEIRP
jgi:hypothetical protein